MAPRRSTTRGFKRTATLLNEQIRRAGESRGFAVTRVLTHWAEIAGPDMAAVSRPVKIGYGRGGFGATLTVLTTGSHAPMLDMQKDQLRDRVNAVYGYNAISRVRITQTAPTGFAEGQARFERPEPPPPPEPAPEICRDASETAGAITDDGLRAALERLGRNVLSRHRH
ncbi:DUF721 domain-containing protein [Antarcticimicrobium luteum]|uniref:DUF721 domain-containing protein n=1 Tax=Antarcticimicrobium luteum TaxID=2547397 RepID=A0A4R5V2Z2_9RHOB|nr:DciA family protein [Antarcticimicrobium luteum]TDK46203.1 DUF721 domain-containing protein [Antarcticimicrobium luteum]